MFHSRTGFITFIALTFIGFSSCLAGLQNDRDIAAITCDTLKYDKAGQAVVRQACRILDSLPHVKQKLDDAIPRETPDDLRPACMFVAAATWADRIAKTDDEDHDEDRPSWHFIAIPTNRDGKEGGEPPRKLDLGVKKPLELALDKNSKLNLVQALELNEMILKDPATPRERRAIALCWFLNLMADMQLPSHTSSLFSPDFPSGDDCGADFMVSNHGKIESWRTLWDSFDEPKTSLETVKRYSTAYPFHTPAVFDDPRDPLDYSAFAQDAHKSDRSFRLEYSSWGVSAAALKEGSKPPPKDLPDDFYTNVRAVMQDPKRIGAHHLSLKLRQILGDEDN